MKNRFDLIIFDWDGTLVDSIDWIVHSLQSAARHCGCAIPSPQSAKDIIGLSIDNAMRTLFPDVDAATIESLVGHYSETFFSKRIDRNDLFDGVYDMLTDFKRQGYLLAIATGKNHQGLVKAVAATEVGDLFVTSRCADQTASKPHPLMLEEIMIETGVDKTRTLMVGDSAHDLQMAGNAGVAAIGVACGAHSTAVLQQYNPLLCLQQTAELRNII